MTMVCRKTREGWWADVNIVLSSVFFAAAVVVVVVMITEKVLTTMAAQKHFTSNVRQDELLPSEPQPTYEVLYECGNCAESWHLQKVGGSSQASERCPACHNLVPPGGMVEVSGG